jgi:hypothetical protein
MRSRESIIRILAALRAKFQEGSGCSEAEASAAMEQYNKLMIEYDLQETDVHIREQGVGKQSYRHSEQGRNKPEWYYILNNIATLSDTRIIWHLGKKEAVIYGTQADRDYAEFLIRVVINTIETSWKTYRYSWDYTRLAKHNHGRHIRNTFRKAIVVRLAQRINDLIAMNKAKATGTGLVVVKQELIKKFIEDDGTKVRKGTSLSFRSNLESTIHHAYEAANKAQLQHQTTNETRLLEGK